MWTSKKFFFRLTVIFSIYKEYVKSFAELREMGLTRISALDNQLPFHEYYFIDTVEEIGLIECARQCTFYLPRCAGILYNRFRSCKLLKGHFHTRSSNRSEEGWQFLSNNKACKSGWAPFDGHCYLYSKTKMDWDVAKGECNRNNAKLVEIETESENSWIMETFLPTEADCPSFWGCSVWIGATDRDMEGRFVWDSDQRPVNFTRWSPGNPNNEGPSGEQHCVDLMISGEWDDGECEALMGFVCEMDY